MPRVARTISNTKVYHTILRGNDKQDIFYDEQDYKKFLKEIINVKEKYQCELYAYCMMPNHVHMIIYDVSNKISKIMQSIAVSYASYFSKKYEKVGHLFQNRFLSKNVETREYLLDLVRYIHQNPSKAGIENIDKYKWSSYQEYTCKKDIISVEKILSLLGNTKQDSIKNFIYFHNNKEEGINDEIEYEFINKLTDSQLKEKIEKLLKVDNVTELRRYNTKIRNEKLKQLNQIKATNKTQLSRVLGINRKILERAMK